MFLPDKKILCKKMKDLGFFNDVILFNTLGVRHFHYSHKKLISLTLLTYIYRFLPPPLITLLQ